MIYKKTITLPLVALLMVSTSALAGNWYVGAEVGSSNLSDKAYTDTDTLSYTYWSDITDTGAGFTGEAGYQFNPVFALSLQVYRYSNSLNDTTDNFPAGSDTISATVSTLNISFTAPMQGKFKPFVEFGSGWYTPSGTLADIFTDSSYSGFQAGIGFKVALNDQVSLVADYRAVGSYFSNMIQWVSDGANFRLPDLNSANIGVHYNFV